LIFTGCNGNESGVNKTQKYTDVDSIHTDYLVRYSDENDSTNGSSFGYRNIQGEIIIANGKYQHCFTDTFKNFAFVFDDKLTKSKIVAINRNENVLFEAYMFDNGPDWLKDGLFRIVRNGKIGYSDSDGVVVIKPKYECADRFENGIARVALECKIVENETDPEHTITESTAWFYIDKKGNRIK